MTRQPGQGAYARVEREQRWLAASVPPDAVPLATISDRYLSGTRLRLRRSEHAAGVDLKLGQKVRVQESDPEVVKLTNIYLSDDEHNVFTNLPAATLTKERLRLTHAGRPYGVNVFTDRWRGLILIETELAADDALLPMPPFAVVDVTADDRFSGGALAFADGPAVASLLTEVAELTGRT